MPVSIVLPAYHARNTLLRAVNSVLAQSYPDWELLIVSDDGHDYAPQLAAHGMRNRRIRLISTGKYGSGAASARNVGIEQAQHPHIALLDADDAFHPDKLQQMAPLLSDYPIITSAFEVIELNGASQHIIADTGIDGALPASMYKQLHHSGDSVIMFDKARIPCRYDESLTVLEDYEFLLQAFCHTPHIYHIASPLHFYYKTENSLTHQPGVHARFIQAKEILMKRLQTGYYALTKESLEGNLTFLEASLQAEKHLQSMQAEGKNICFEKVMHSFISTENAPRATAASSC